MFNNKKGHCEVSPCVVDILLAAAQLQDRKDPFAVSWHAKLMNKDVL